ncbi:putative hydro-lyase [Citreicella sp. C3M06]|uniref:putative hydro-lyase n=1 Tax=Citreicella sp. C3M06 TaxID=2841564 RepID=UPI001C092ADD|nr:putative hydro-lyase [Citreicella sp. C3M06]MBU2960290.1 putative hydro-lyase [Citreicella sp. C3M06]
MDVKPKPHRTSHPELTGLSAPEVRQVLRANAYFGHTAGLCTGRLQCNLVILPAADGVDFQRFCQENPVFCPLIAASAPGETGFADLGADIDLRSDLPLYFVYRPGQAVERVQDIKALWRDDFMAFAVGCSFTFENALMRAGVEMRHVTEDVTVPMYRSNIATTPVGRFGGPAVVSMRPIPKERADDVRRICQAFPHAHGAPVHIGDPAEIGITDITSPDWGAAVTIKDGEVPAFWGCGVTTQVALSNAAPEIAITHAPGAMLITDADEAMPTGFAAP